MVHSKRKGKRGELEARDLVRKHWNSPACERTAQVSGKFSADLMNGPPDFHIEVKRHERIAATRFMDQAVKDKQKGEIPVVLMRENRSEWLVMFRLRDSQDFALGLLHQAKNMLP